MLKEHLEKLNHFSGSVRAGSIRGYAVAHRLSQPAVSKSIQLLEADLETSLLIRDREGVRLTKSGEKLFAFAERLLSESAELDAEIRSDGAVRIAGSLTMGTYQSIAVYFVPLFFKFVRREQKDLKMSLITAGSADLVLALRSGKTDFIVSIDPPKDRGFHQMKILSDTYSLYRSVRYREKISESPIFTLPEATDREGKSLREHLRDARLESGISSAGDFEAVKALVREGIGYGFLPDRVARSSVERGLLEPVTEFRKLLKVGEHDLVFSCRKHRASDAALKWVSDQLLTLIRQNKDL